MQTAETDLTIIAMRNADCAVHLALPSGEGKYPSLILIEEVWGVNDNIKDVANRLAKEGFMVAAPELLPDEVLAAMTPELIAAMRDRDKRADAQPKLRTAMRPTLQPAFAEGAVKKLKTCVDYLLAHPQSNGKVGVLGFCFGGTYSFYLALNDPRLNACVVFYGHNPEPLDRVATIGCPVVALYGERDENLISALPHLEEEMSKHHKSFESVVYPGVGHAFFNDTNPVTYGGKKVAADAWDRSLAFLRKYLA